MKWLFLFSSIAAGILLSGMLTEARLNNADYLAHLSAEAEIEENTDLQPEEIRRKARAVTVKVLTGKTWGSGISIAHQDNFYTIVTNSHVLAFSRDKTYRVQTPDGKIYPARVVREFEGRDLALLQFKSDLKYETVELTPIASSSLVVEEEVFAVGFPVEIEGQKIKGFYFNDGRIVKFSKLDFGGGYQIGYTNSIKKGMSGGALFNSEGKVVGINGMHKYPLWGNPYNFSDGSLASESQQQEMSKFSWAIPINTFLDLAPQFSASN